MKIYTKTGDKGQTSLLGGSRVPKTHLRIEAYGSVDELNAHLGLVRDQAINQQNTARQALLLSIQNNLFVVGSILATASAEEREKFKLPSLCEDDILALEQAIDDLNETLPPLRNFILPGGHPSISMAQVARCVCRRAERQVIALSLEASVDDIIIQYLNRLSDYLFMLCRQMHQELEVEETPWKPRS